MIQSKAWEWEIVDGNDTKYWKTPSIESYYLINRWKRQSKSIFWIWAAALADIVFCLQKRLYHVCIWFKWSCCHANQTMGTDGRFENSLCCWRYAWITIWRRQLWLYSQPGCYISFGYWRCEENISRNFLYYAPAGWMLFDTWFQKRMGISPALACYRRKYKNPCRNRSGKWHSAFLRRFRIDKKLFKDFEIIFVQHINGFINDGELHSDGWHWHILFRKQ